MHNTRYNSNHSYCYVALLTLPFPRRATPVRQFATCGIHLDATSRGWPAEQYPGRVVEGGVGEWVVVGHAPGRWSATLSGGGGGESGKHGGAAIELWFCDLPKGKRIGVCWGVVGECWVLDW